MSATKIVKKVSALTKAKGPKVNNARQIIVHTRESAHSFSEVFEDRRRARNAKGGPTTDEEQDLLRAMLVFAAAGLDATIKQLIRDCLPSLAKVDKKVREEMEKFVIRKVEKSESDSEIGGRKFLAKILVAASHQEQVIKEYIDDITGGSLQSPQEVMKSVFALGLDPASVDINVDQLKPIFKARNKIVHELDINLKAKRRNREVRKIDEMHDYTRTILVTGEKILLGVHQKLKKK